jgi:DNA processing protein
MPGVDTDFREVEAWQTLLALEANSAKTAKLAALIQKGAASTDILGHPSVTAIEAQRAATLNNSALKNAFDDGIRFLKDSEYPAVLSQTHSPPCGLFVRGDWSVTSERTIAIVGTRGAGTYGKAVAMKFAEAFGKSGVTVVSGGALGIDAAAHKGALEGGGKTVAVLAGGVDKQYPAVNAPLFRRIIENGCLVSQFAIGARPNAYKFLVRNGLIAALSEAVLVVEAPTRSGALATAHAAAELGREVFVVPSNIDNLNFSGSHALIRDGATLVTHPEEVLEQMGILNLRPDNEKLNLSETAAQIISVLSVQPISTEKIIELTALDPSTVMAELTMLELEGAVIRDAGGYATKP